MNITILTLFPEMFVGPFDASIIKRAKEKNIANITLVNIRDFGLGKHKSVDDKPFGGGVGMVMRVDVLDNAIQAVRISGLSKWQEQCVLLDARGKQFSQTVAKQYSILQHLILICGHYEGVDERVRNLVDSTISVGDFILTGGEIPAMLVTDATIRLISGVLKTDATTYESFTSPSSFPLLEYPQYTIPRTYQGLHVPEVLTSGNHKKISLWKQQQAKEITARFRPDLLDSLPQE